MVRIGVFKDYRQHQQQNIDSSFNEDLQEQLLVDPNEDDPSRSDIYTEMSVAASNIPSSLQAQKLDQPSIESNKNGTYRKNIDTLKAQYKHPFE